MSSTQGPSILAPTALKPPIQRGGSSPIRRASPGPSGLRRSELAGSEASEGFVVPPPNLSGLEVSIDLPNPDRLQSPEIFSPDWLCPQHPDELGLRSGHLKPFKASSLGAKCPRGSLAMEQSIDLYSLN